MMKSFVLLLTLIPCIISDVLLYNLTSDPYESTNVYSDSSYSYYTSYFSQRASYWVTQIHTSETPTQTGKTEAWTAAGGIVPWVTSSFQPLTITQKYSYSDAPNVVFVFVDDWGFNDVGFRSTYMSWTTPTFDKLKEESVLLSNYNTYYICSPSRASLMTGQFALRTGITTNGPELPLDEITLAQEMKSAGYRTYGVGKWHLGTSTKQHLPTNRGFDYYYGYLSADEDYYSKRCSENGNFYDFHENENLVQLDTTVHNAYLFQSKVESLIREHATNYQSTPMFLYYPLQLIHWPWTAPDIYLNKCAYPSGLDSATASTYQNYCGLNVMMDEVLANLTCALETYGFANNTVLVIAGDNGGETSQQGSTTKLSGNSYPFRGHKQTYFRGGVSNTAIIHSQLVPARARGTSYSGQVHVSDWLPTLMGLATNGQWTSSYGGNTIDGVDMWDTIVNNETTKHTEIVHYISQTSAVIQQDMIKYFNGIPLSEVEYPKAFFDSDLYPDNTHTTCENPSLVD